MTTWCVRGYDQQGRQFWESGFEDEVDARAEYDWNCGNMTGTHRIELVEVHAEFERPAVAADRPPVVEAIEVGSRQHTRELGETNEEYADG